MSEDPLKTRRRFLSEDPVCGLFEIEVAGGLAEIVAPDSQRDARMIPRHPGYLPSELQYHDVAIAPGS